MSAGHAGGRVSSLLVGLGCLLLVVCAGLVDNLTGTELRVYPLYFMAVILAAWRFGLGGAIAAALLSSLAWAVSNHQAGLRYEHGYLLLVNALVHGTTFVIVGALISNLHRRLRRESAFARTDPLTNLPNSRAFFERASFELKRARRYRHPFAIAFIDLDHFKAVNDRFGHEAGDEALRVAAGVMLHGSRETDLVARLGGDEFVMVLPETEPGAVRGVLDRIREQVERQMALRGWPVTVTIGATVYLRPPPNLEHALREADTLMYRAKEAGRNTVIVDVAPPGTAGLDDAAAR